MINARNMHIQDNDRLGVVDKNIFNVFMFATLVWCPPVNDNVDYNPPRAA
jgi:hypothetical protein